MFKITQTEELSIFSQFKGLSQQVFRNELDEEQKQSLLKFHQRKALLFSIFSSVYHLISLSLHGINDEKYIYDDNVKNYNYELGKELYEVTYPALKILIAIRLITIVIYFWYPSISHTFHL